MCNPLRLSPRAPLPFLDDTHPSVHLGRPAIRHGVRRRRPPTDPTGAVIANSAFSANTCGRGEERANKGPSALRANLTCISWSSDCDPIRLAREEAKEGKENHLPPSLSFHGSGEKITFDRRGWDRARKEKERLGSGRKSCL